MVQEKDINKLPYRIRYDIMITLAKAVHIHSDSYYALSENIPENFPTIRSWLVKKKKSHDLIVPKGFRKKRCSGLKSMSPTSKGGKRGQETSLPVLALTLCPHPRRWCPFRSFAGVCALHLFLSLTLQVSPNWDGSKQPAQQRAEALVGTHTVATHMSPSPSGSNKEMK